MDTEAIIEALEAEKERLETAIAALQGHRSGRSRRTATNGRRGKGHMSAAARKRIGEAKKKWWAEHRKK